MTNEPIAWWKTLYWNIRRELWECRYVWLVPALVAAIAVCAFLIFTVQMADTITSLTDVKPRRQESLLLMPFSAAVFFTLLSSVVVACVYCAEAARGERADRSVWFWQSMPVSNASSVLAKFAVPMVVQPVATVVFALLATALMWGISALSLALSGAGVQTLLKHGALATLWPGAVYGIAASAIWFAPIYAWFLLNSSFVRRAPLVWAILVPLGVCAFEKLAFDSTRGFEWLRGRVISCIDHAYSSTTAVSNDPSTVAPMEIISPAPLQFVTSTEVWVGLALATVFVYASIRLRSWREPD